MIYGYARVSTKNQYDKKNSIENQREALQLAGAEVIYEDDFTGTKIERPKFSKLLDELKPGDTLVVTNIDRIARSFWGGKDLIAELLNRDISVNILNIGVMDNTPIGKATRNMFFVFAELERDQIVERTQEGIARAKQRNPEFKLGRKNKFSKVTMAHALELLQTHSYKEVSEITGISRSTLHRHNIKAKAKKETP